MLRRVYVSHTLHNLQNPRSFVNFGVNYFFRNPRWCQPWVLGLTNTSDNETTELHLNPSTCFLKKVHPLAPRIHPIIPWLFFSKTRNGWALFHFLQVEQASGRSTSNDCWREHPQGMITPPNSSFLGSRFWPSKKTYQSQVNWLGAFFFQLQEIWWRTIF